MSLHTGKPPKSTRKDPRGREEARRENRAKLKAKPAAGADVIFARPRVFHE